MKKREKDDRNGGKRAERGKEKGKREEKKRNISWLLQQISNLNVLINSHEKNYKIKIWNKKQSIILYRKIVLICLRNNFITDTH